MNPKPRKNQIWTKRMPWRLFIKSGDEGELGFQAVLQELWRTEERPSVLGLLFSVRFTAKGLRYTEQTEDWAKSSRNLLAHRLLFRFLSAFQAMIVSFRLLGIIIMVVDLARKLILKQGQWNKLKMSYYSILGLKFYQIIFQQQFS